MVQTEQTPATDAPTDAAVEYGKRSFEVADVYVAISGVSMYATPKAAHNITDARRMAQKMGEAVTYFEQQAAAYGREITAKVKAERDEARHRRQGRK